MKTPTVGWVLASALAAGWLLRRRGEWEVGAGSVHLYSNRTLPVALDLCEALATGDPDGHTRAVVRYDSEVLAVVHWRDEAARRRARRGGTVAAEVDWRQCRKD